MCLSDCRQNLSIEICSFCDAKKKLMEGNFYLLGRQPGYNLLFLVIKTESAQRVLGINQPLSD